MDLENLEPSFKAIIAKVAEKNKGVLAAKTPCMEAWTETEHLTGKYIDALKQGRLNPADAPPLGMPEVVLNVLETNYTTA